MDKKHPDRIKGYYIETVLVMEKEIYESKEDFHGGPGYYPARVILASTTRKIQEHKVAAEVDNIVKDQFKS